MEMRVLDGGRRPRWVWYVIALVAVAAGLLLVFAVNLSDRLPTTDDGVSDLHIPDSRTVADAILAFAAFTTDRRTAREAALDNTYIAEGLRRLAAALYGLTNRNRVVRSTLHATVAADLLDAASDVERDEHATPHAQIVQGALARAGAAITTVQRSSYPELSGAAAELQDAVKAVRADRPLSSQTEAIQRFFDRASDMLRSMAEVGL